MFWWFIQISDLGWVSGIVFLQLQNDRSNFPITPNKTSNILNQVHWLISIGPTTWLKRINFESNIILSPLHKYMENVEQFHEYSTTEFISYTANIYVRIQRDWTHARISQIHTAILLPAVFKLIGPGKFNSRIENFSWIDFLKSEVTIASTSYWTPTRIIQ